MASKKNLIILLIMPFAISLLSFTAISMTFNLIDNDIIDIDWSYNQEEAFALRSKGQKYKLSATAINDKNYPTNQSLKWSVYNEDGTSEPYAEIVEEKGSVYLVTLKEGVVIVTCTNDKGNVQKSMKVTIYADSAIILNPKVAGSSSNVDKNIYYGQFDMFSGNKSLSSIQYDLAVYTTNNDSDAEIIGCSSNVSYDNAKKVINFKYGGENKVEPAYVTLGFTNPFYVNTFTYNFNIVTNGVNVYNYNDLLACTNKSSAGEIMVLRKNFENAANLTTNNANNTVLFGNKVGNGYNFKNEVYHFETHFNHQYIDQWNKMAGGDDRYNTISKEIYVGLRVQKDIYGNGFTINLHNLTYPYESIQGLDSDGNPHLVPKLSNDNIFRGPLPYYSLGNNNGSSIVTAYGQDNIGVYVNGDNITINDVIIKNCDFGDNLANLDTVGTVLETRGNNIVIKNSRLSNGKNIIKTYDSKDVLIDNCMLSYSRNFLLMAGSYDYLTIKSDNYYQFTTESGLKKSYSVTDYLSRNGDGNTALNNYMMGIDNGHSLEAMRSIQSVLDSALTNTYKGEVTVRDTMFYLSGIASIGLESLFNGPFLFNAAPTMIIDTFNNYSAQLDGFGVNIPLIPSEVGGISYPVKVHLAGKTKFYDYKSTDIFDINGLVGQDIGNIIATMGVEVKVDLDTIFPIKTMLVEEADKLHARHQGDINIPIAYYGGGVNLSKIIYEDDFEYKSHLTNEFDLDFLARYVKIGNQGTGMMANAVGIMLKSVTVVAGFNPFKFAVAKGDGYLYDEAPKVQTLIDNCK